MSRLSGQHLLADTVDTNAIHAEADARRRAELDDAIRRERGLPPITVAPPPSPQPSPEPKKEDPMENETTERVKCPTPRCPTILRRNNKTGMCGYCQAGKTAHLLPIEPGADLDLLRGEREEPAKKAPGKKTTAPAITGGVEKLRLVAEALGFNADAVLDELAGEWLTKVGNQVREAADA